MKELYSKKARDTAALYNKILPWHLRQDQKKWKLSERTNTDYNLANRLQSNTILSLITLFIDPPVLVSKNWTMSAVTKAQEGGKK